MAETPSEGNASSQKKGSRLTRRSQLLLIGALLVAVAAVAVIVILLVMPRDDANNGGSAGSDASVTDVTSPYDLHELSADTGPGDVEEASLVSISLVAEDGSADYYGLSSDTEPAKALMKAVADAEEVDTEEVDTEETSTTDATEVGSDTLVSTLTFLFPDRTTLAFELDVDEGTISRGGRVWRVDGDLAALVDAAISLHVRQ